MAERYFVNAPITSDLVTLRTSEAHHLIHVMRAKPGAPVLLFDGSGAEYPARVVRIGRADVELAVLGRQEISRELSVRVTLGVCLPKGERQRWLVEKAVELGVTTLIPLATDRSVVSSTSKTMISRLRRIVIEASKQCGRNVLLEVGSVQTLEAYVESIGPRSTCWMAHPGGANLPEVLEPFVRRRPPEIALAVGPEGGFTDEEVVIARDAGWQIVGLGSRLMRIETAAAFLASNIAAHCG